MSKSDQFDPRLKAYLHRGSSALRPVGMEERIVRGAPHRRTGWMLQIAAAAALFVLAVGLGIVIQHARQSVGVGPSPTPAATPSSKPTPSPTPAASGEPYPLLPPASMRMIDASIGWAAGSGTNRILRTTDGGSHWNDVTPRAARAGTWATFFLDGNRAWLASAVDPASQSQPIIPVAIYHTADGGRSWQEVGQADASGWLVSMQFADAAHGWLFVRSGSTFPGDGSALYGTMDGGTSWALFAAGDASGKPGQLPLRCGKLTPVFVNSATGWMPGACNDGGGPFFYVTHDGGQTWSDAGLSMPPGYSRSCLCGFSSLRFSDSRNGVVVLEATGAEGLPKQFLYATHDGGSSWQPGPMLPPNCYAVYFVNPSTGWTLDAKANAILQTNNGGVHWSTLGTVPSVQGVMDFQFVNATTGWALGSEPGGDTLIRTSDGGRSWTMQLSP